MATLNSEFKIARAELINESAYVASRTRSLRYVQRKTTGQAWDFNVRSTKIEDINIKKVIASIGAINRDNADLQLYIPIWSDSLATTTTALTSAVRGEISISMTSIVGIEIGDFFTYGNHSKAYQVSDVVGSVVTFTPNLVVDVSSSTVVTFDGMTFNFKIAGRPQTYPLSSTDQSMEIELDLIEKW
jgi:hypothetical protein